VTEALAAAAQTGERFEAELYRLRGELAQLVAVPDPVQPSAEESMRKALEIAREQDARALELRAALSLGRLWRADGREADARLMVAEVRGAFTEALETVDLREAQAFLDAPPVR
jgi:hypothetical protein